MAGRFTPDIERAAVRRGEAMSKAEETNRKGEEAAAKVFLSFHYRKSGDGTISEDEIFVRRVKYFLDKQAAIAPYCYPGGPGDPDWRQRVGPAMAECSRFVLFVGEDLGDHQWQEADVFLKAHSAELLKAALCVLLPGARGLDGERYPYNGCTQVKVRMVDLRGDPDGFDHEACRVAKEIVKHFSAGTFIPDDGLPIGYCFEWEKQVIEAFAEGEGLLTGPKRVEAIEVGCPLSWPPVRKLPAQHDNPVPEAAVGKYRPEDARILVDTRSQYHAPEKGASACLARSFLFLPEAGPRERLRYPLADQGLLRVGVLVSGGIAPGINAVIEGLVERHALYQLHSEKYGSPGYQLEIRGYEGGFSGLYRGDSFELLTSEKVRKQADLGGSMLATARFDPLLDLGERSRRKACSDRLKSIVRRLSEDRVDILYVIGGDGSMRAAHAIWTTGQGMLATGEIKREISVVAIPKTMDNDILWVWQSFGFLSAVEKAKEFVGLLHTEVSSNPRLGVVQLFGSDSGFVVSHAALGSGLCDPEVPFTIEEVSREICRVLERRHKPTRGQLPYAIILMAETAIPADVEKYIEEPIVGLDDNEKYNEKEAIRRFVKNHRRIQGQTPDELRTAGLKVLSRLLQAKIREMPLEFWKDYRVVTSEPRHLVRAITPSVLDVVFGRRLGSLAVDNAMAGYTDFMISQWLTEYVLVPLRLVVLGRKRVRKDGIFWKSVSDITRQRAATA
jgi:6-phosphofructokinase 1